MLKEQIKNMKESEILNLYSGFTAKACRLELDEIDKIVNINFKTFEKINSNIVTILEDIKRYKKNDDFVNIMNFYNKIVEGEYFSILLSKILLISFNDIDNSGTNFDDNQEKFLKKQSDILNFVKEKIWFLYLHMISFNKINSLIGFQSQILDNIEFTVLKIIRHLCEQKILKEKNIKILNKTIKFIEIIDLNTTFKISIYTEPFKILNNLENINLKSEYIINNTIFSIYEINKVSHKTGSQFRIGENSFIEEINKNKISIDLKNLKEIFKNYCKKEKIDENIIEENYIRYKEDLKKFIFEQNSFGIKKISKKMSIYRKAMIFENIIKIIEEKGIYSFYLPFVIDFRGRIYKLSSISPTFFKEIRYSIFFENRDKEKKIEKEISIIQKKIEDTIYKYRNKINNLNLYNKECNLNKKEKISLLWVLISIGQIFRKELNTKVNIEEFLNISIEKLNNFEKIDKNDNEEFNYLSKILYDIVNNKKSNKLISKDATASVYQHLILLLDAIDDESYKYTNLTDLENWYDTYSMIIEKWKKDEKDLYSEKKEIIDKIFNRTNLKKTMMTENYGCGKNKCWKYFKLESKIEENDEIKKIFFNFYKYITNNGIFKQNSSEIINKIMENDGKIINKVDKSETNLMYKKKKERRINTTYKNKRYTYKKMDFIDLEDRNNFLINDFKISVRANTIHFIDSSVVREVLKRIRCVAIHDCFMVEPHNISKLLAIVNYVMNMEYIKLNSERSEKKIFSLFILL